jgi:hypothetical protein
MIDKIIHKIDQIPEGLLLAINICFAVFVILAHGGALAIAYYTDAEAFDKILPLARVTLPLAFFILFSAIVAFSWKKSLQLILSCHAAILTVGAFAMLAWAASILIQGIPKGRFAWTPGFLTLFAVYPVYLLRRTLLKGMILKSKALNYLHVIVFVIALVLDIGVFFKLMSTIQARF